MKKKLARILAVVLVAMMLIPAIATIAVRAQETEPTIKPEDNKFVLAGKDVKPSNATGATKGQTVSASGQFASEPFDVTKGVVLYFGPCPAPTDENHKKMDFLVAYYNKSGKYSASRKLTEMQTNIYDTLDDGSVIYQLKITSTTYKAAALRGLNAYADYMVLTIDKPFTAEDYYAYADSQEWDIDSAGIRIPPPQQATEAPAGFDGIWNLFPREGDRNDDIRQHQNNEYVMSYYIPVVEGDVITMGAISTAETRSILYAYDEDYKEVKNYKRTDIGIDFVENIGYSFAIYSHTVPAGVAFVRVCVHSGINNDGDILVTRNKAFTGAELRETLGIADLSDEAKAHPFYGKNALFVGDSISYGSYDTPPTYRNPSASWARRLALATGLIPTNVSYPGASVSKTGLSNVKWEYDLLKTAMMSKKDYQMVIFHGGLNDARQNREVGTAMPADTDRSILAENERVATFAGGLQLMFHDAQERWPEAELYYIANFKLDPESSKGKDMEEYYAQAKILCAEYGVHYIDLYNDVELYEDFDYDSTTVLPDLIHPTSEAYDLLFPAVLRLFNATLNDKDEENSGTDTETTPEETTPATPDDNQGSDDEEPSGGLSTGAIIGIVAAAVVVVAGGFAVYWFVIRKKKAAK